MIKLLKEKLSENSVILISLVSLVMIPSEDNMTVTRRHDSMKLKGMKFELVELE